MTLLTPNQSRLLDYLQNQDFQVLYHRWEDHPMAVTVYKSGTEDVVATFSMWDLDAINQSHPLGGKLADEENDIWHYRSLDKQLQ